MSESITVNIDFSKSVPYANCNLPNTKSADSAILLNNGSQRFILTEF